MANITIKGIGDELLNKIRKNAARNKRSLNKEIIYQMERIVSSTPTSYDEIKAIRARRKYEAKGVLTEEQIRLAIESGRS